MRISPVTSLPIPAVTFGLTQFGMDEGCCDKRKKGIPQDCCPFKPEEVDAFKAQGITIELKPATAEAKDDKKPGNFITRFFKGIGEWFAGFFRGIRDDVKEVFRKLSGKKE